MSMIYAAFLLSFATLVTANHRDLIITTTPAPIIVCPTNHYGSNCQFTRCAANPCANNPIKKICTDAKNKFTGDLIDTYNHLCSKCEINKYGDNCEFTLEIFDQKTFLVEDVFEKEWNPSSPRYGDLADELKAEISGKLEDSEVFSVLTGSIEILTVRPIFEDEEEENRRRRRRKRRESSNQASKMLVGYEFVAVYDSAKVNAYELKKAVVAKTGVGSEKVTVKWATGGVPKSMMILNAAGKLSAGLLVAILPLIF